MLNTEKDSLPSTFFLQSWWYSPDFQRHKQTTFVNVHIWGENITSDPHNNYVYQWDIKDAIKYTFKEYTFKKCANEYCNLLKLLTFSYISKPLLYGRQSPFCQDLNGE